MDPIKDQEAIDAMNASLSASAQFRRNQQMTETINEINRKLDAILARMGDTVKSTKSKVQ